MAITSSAKKAHRSSLKKRVFNIRRKRAMKDVLKKNATFVVEKKGNEAQSLLPKAYKVIDKSAKRGLIKKNTASRKKSRLVASIKRIL